MRRNLLLLSILILLSVLAAGGCTPVTTTSTTPVITGEKIPIPLNIENWSSGFVAPDDPVPTPGSAAYRANVHEQGVPDRWPEIETVETRLAAGSRAVFVRYRAEITTKAGEVRNNILTIRKESGRFDTDDNLDDVVLYTIGAPADLVFYRNSAGGLPGTLAPFLVIVIPPGLPQGRYDFLIGIEIKGKDYGTLPCSITVEGVAAQDEIIRGAFGYIEYSSNYFIDSVKAVVPDGWSAINSAGGELGTGANAIYLGYRDHITAKAGETRNNIFRVTIIHSYTQLSWSEKSLKLEMVGAPKGMQTKQTGFFAHLNSMATVLVMEIPAGMKPGRYDFSIRVTFKDVDYGTLPCSVMVQ